MRYLKNVRFKNRSLVWINMDETGMNTKVATTYGLFSHDPDRTLMDKVEHTKRMRTVPCTLLGTICSMKELQKSLPQVILPKYVNQKSPPERLKKAFAGNGAPIEAWHKTGGWNNTLTMKMWLKKIVACVTKYDPNLHIVLQLDCSSVHLNMDTLRCAKQLNITVLMVPARCTWVLQPLDVYVYASLKRSLRRGLSRHELSSDNGNIDMVSRISITGQSIQEVLVNGDWSRSMVRLGIGDDAEMKPGVMGLCEGCDMSPRLPSVDELKFLLGKFGKHGKVDWHKLLLDPVPRLTQKAAAKSSSSSSSAAATASTSSSSSTAVPVSPDGSTPTVPAAPKAGTAVAFEPEKFVPKVVGVRLFTKRLPSATNLDVERPHSDRVGPAAGTRSEVAAKAKSSSSAAETPCTE